MSMELAVIANPGKEISVKAKVVHNPSWAKPHLLSFFHSMTLEE